MWERVLPQPSEGVRGEKMFRKRDKKKEAPVAESAPEPKPTPAFLRPDYPYQAIGEPITDLDSLEPHEVYEIKCHQCEMSIRTQGVNIKAQYERLAESGCIGCGNKDLVVKKVDMSAAKKEQGGGLDRGRV